MGRHRKRDAAVPEPPIVLPDAAPGAWEEPPPELWQGAPVPCGLGWPQGEPSSQPSGDLV